MSDSVRDDAEAANVESVPGGAWLAFAAGLGLALAAGVTLWASEGAQVFAETAFAALAACF